MIDVDRLKVSYDNDSFYSLQLEVGDRCEQDCIYCYMNAVPNGKNTLTDEEIYHILHDCKKLGITAIEWLGGEPLLRKSIFELMQKAKDLGLRNNIWTGGLPLKDHDIIERCIELANPGLISVHVSTVNKQIYRILHPNRTENDLDTILDSVSKLIDIGYRSDRMLNSVTYTGIQDPNDMIATIDYFEEEFGIGTSLNVFHTYLRPGIDPGDMKYFIPNPSYVEKVYSRIAQQAKGIRIPMNCVDKFYCSTTLAVLCDGSVTPCATIREEDAPNIHNENSFISIVEKNKDHLTFNLFRNKNNLPSNCQVCGMNDICFGCRSRSYSAGFGLYGPDPRCFRKNL